MALYSTSIWKKSLVSLGYDTAGLAVEKIDSSIKRSRRRTPLKLFSFCLCQSVTSLTQTGSAPRKQILFFFIRKCRILYTYYTVDESRKLFLYNYYLYYFILILWSCFFLQHKRGDKCQMKRVYSWCNMEIQENLPAVLSAYDCTSNWLRTGGIVELPWLITVDMSQNC